ncbi:hypothetical protein BAZMOX_532623_0 [methanotrophic endosymbiont of Bathymodiolus azoricus (Menez Gwen)]|nr:hypothetical protein BAZMOX_532623_0 [methanotrophic endosymbiont of Bathymodiolus azoricus (Menez Gwen)]
MKLTHNLSYPLLLVIFKSAIFLHNVWSGWAGAVPLSTGGESF